MAIVARQSREPLFRDVLESRRSIRDFLPTEVTPDILRSVLVDALSAPSWSNTRPYTVAIATGEVRDRISTALLHRADDILQARRPGIARLWRLGKLLGLLRSDFRIPVVYPDELRTRQISLAKALYGHLGIARHDIVGREREIRRNMEFFGAPVALFIFARKGMGVYSALDAGHFMQTLMLAARARGLDTCAQGFLTFWSKPIRREFDVPRGYKLLCGMSVGYRTESRRNDFVPPMTLPEDITIRRRQG